MADTEMYSGGGIGGLTCAVALSRIPGVEVSVYEAAREFSEVGAGIGMSARTWRLFKTLDLDADLSKVTILRPADELGEYPSRTRVYIDLMVIIVKVFGVRKSDKSEGRNITDLSWNGT